MRLEIYLTRRLSTNPALVGWGLLFIVFWAIIGAFVESASLPPHLPNEAYEFYTSSWYGVLILLSFSSIGVSLMYSVAYHTGSIPYLLRSSKMKALDYILGLTISGVVTSLIYSLILLALVDLFFSYHFGFQISPANLPLILISGIFAGIFFTSFSLFLQLLVIKYLGFNLATNQIVSFVPLILGYAFGFASLYTNLGNLVYGSPFADMEYLLVEGYYGHQIHLRALDSVTASSSGDLFSVGIGSMTLVVWIALLFSISLLIFNRMYYRNIYESKTV
ncbi:hypothetical protein [Metallosphaera hakonensis]|uniref:Uncharacterized protein n=1 Tax=Metallosphaera hakonensis JCM 8857 = DSM 7519 TaxID=1293036 RepID=A0A2U9IRD8_9CREN|nr:hypothetical protein [Metallosphaera hakonensis]AWR98544.1 hypothetical protein DFR87_01190 [Metallosphaera hakonensis JCM 8857 = DSM 7519]